MEAMKRFLPILGIVVLLSCILLGGIFFFSAMSSDSFLYYLANEQLYQIDRECTSAIPWTGDGKIISIASSENMLCAAVKPTDNNEELLLYIYDAKKQTWRCLENATLSYGNDLLIDGGFVYYICDVSESDSDRMLARISTDGGEPEVLGISRFWQKGCTTITDFGIYTLDYPDSGEGPTLYCNRNGSIITYALACEDCGGVGSIQLSGSWIYKVLPGNLESTQQTDEIAILRSPLPQSNSDSFNWESIPVLEGVLFSDYENWSPSCVALYENYVFYETPDGTLCLYDTIGGSDRVLWTLPAGQNSSVYEPCYYFSSEGFAVVYSRQYGDADDTVYTGTW